MFQVFPIMMPFETKGKGGGKLCWNNFSNQESGSGDQLIHVSLHGLRFNWEECVLWSDIWAVLYGAKSWC